MGELPFAAKQIGQAWTKGLEEDVCAADGRNILLGECRWMNSPVGTDALNGLREKISSHKELAGYDVFYLYLFARSEFTQTVKEEAGSHS